MDMQHRAATLALVLATGCASDVDLHLGLQGDGPDSGPGVSSSVGPLRAARVLSGPGEVRVIGVAWHPESLVIAGGDFDGTTDLGNGPVDGGQYSMGFVVAYDPANGETIWSHAFTGSSATDASYQLTTSDVMDIAVATDGAILAIGSFGRTIDFGTGPVESTDGCHDGVIARYAADGTALEPIILPRSPLHAVAPMPDDGAVVSGYEVLSDCPWLGGDAAPVDSFLARLASDGHVAWRVSLGDAAHVERITTTSAGDVYVHGTFTGQLTFGDRSIASVYSFGIDSFLARFSPDGDIVSLLGCLRTSEDGGCRPGETATTASGRVVALGTFARRVEMGGVELETGSPDSDETASYIVELGDSDMPQVLAIVDGPVGQAVRVREDPFDLVVAGANSYGDQTGPYVAVLSEGTTLVSARGMSGPELSWGTAWDVATGPAGEIALVGGFHGDADFGDGLVHAETDAEDEGDDGFVAIYDRQVVESMTD
jgi:hypothetical protein